MPVDENKLNDFIIQWTRFDNAITADSNDPFLIYPVGVTVGQRCVVGVEPAVHEAGERLGGSTSCCWPSAGSALKVTGDRARQT